SDTQLSAIFDSSRTPVQMRQALLAETAVIAREHPADARGFLAALPRDIGADADQLNAILDTLSAVQEAPWLELTNMRSLLGRAAGLHHHYLRGRAVVRVAGVEHPQRLLQHAGRRPADTVGPGELLHHSGGPALLGDPGGIGVHGQPDLQQR